MKISQVQKETIIVTTEDTQTNSCIAEVIVEVIDEKGQHWEGVRFVRIALKPATK